MSDREKLEKVAEKWMDRLVNAILAFVFCFVVYVLMQVFVVCSFKIPSDSMEPALLPGDNIWVDKCSTGARLFNLFDVLDGKEVDIHRMPGWRKFRRNDILVFNFPYPGSWDSIALDMRLYYVKRCIALPGDTLEIQNARYVIGGVRHPLGCVDAQDKLQRLLKSGAAEETGIVLKAYPNREEVDWSIKEFGPFYIPCKGAVVEMDALNRLLYSNAIEWEQKKKLSFRGDTVLLGDSVITTYCFRKNYYFVSGDKMENSRDSRYWGLLPEDFIVGRVWRIGYSVDELTDKVRWKRILRNTDNE